jgi:hypothetical protein
MDAQAIQGLPQGLRFLTQHVVLFFEIPALASPLLFPLLESRPGVSPFGGQAGDLFPGCNQFAARRFQLFLETDTSLFSAGHRAFLFFEPGKKFVGALGRFLPFAGASGLKLGVACLESGESFPRFPLRGFMGGSPGGVLLAQTRGFCLQPLKFQTKCLGSLFRPLCPRAQLFLSSGCMRSMFLAGRFQFLADALVLILKSLNNVAVLLDCLTMGLVRILQTRFQVADL